MTNKIHITAGKAGFMICTALLAALTGYATAGSKQPEGGRDHPAVQGQATVAIQDDYDYFPGYETYYSRNRHEYVYYDGNAWVRRPEPRGVSADALLAAPSVRMEFCDSPEQHHSSVIRSYPKDWKRADKAHDDKDDRRQDQMNDRKDGDKKS
jgi:hypothetical protein